MSLCKLCERFTFENVKFAGTTRVNDGHKRSIRFNDDDGYEHHGEVRALAESASKGCSLCSVFNLGICKTSQDHDTLMNEQLTKSRYRILSSYSGKSAQIPTLLLKLGSRPYVEFGISFSAGSLEEVIPSRTVEPDPSSAEALRKIRQWLEDCTKSHPDCSANEHVHLPTRVIDVSEPSPRLCSGKEVVGKYVALSHCWGGVVSYTTTKRTIRQRFRGMDLAEYPKTFRDVVLVTRKLGIRYLWIDSVCIIQDDPDDWEREAAKMMDVYQNSFLTISAMSAANSHEGFLHRRTTPEISSCDIPFNYSAKEARGMVQIFWPPYDLGRDVLSSRGWTLQELILPSRVIHFAAGQLIWDCRAQEREDGLSPAITGYGGARIRARARSKELMLDPYKRWYALVENYTERKVSMQSDKLPAIPGLAQQIQQVTSDEYLAGLWKRDLILGLLWAPSENKTLRRDTSRSRGPSWSWCSVEGKISYAAVLHQRGQQFELDIKGTSVILEGLNPLGEVKRGTIKVECPMKRAIVGKKNVFGLFPFEDHCGEYLPDDGKGIQGTTIWCLKMLSKSYEGRSTVQINPHGLALQQEEEGLGKTTFRRVGVFELEPRPGLDWFADSERIIIDIN